MFSLTQSKLVENEFIKLLRENLKFKRRLQRVFSKGDSHIISALESREQKKITRSMNEQEAFNDKTRREEKLKESNILKQLQETFNSHSRFKQVFAAGSNWNNSQKNGVLKDLTRDLEASKNLERAWLENENKILESRRRIGNFEERSKKVNLNVNRLIEKIHSKRGQMTDSVSHQSLQSMHLLLFRLIIEQ